MATAAVISSNTTPISTYTAQVLKSNLAKHLDPQDVQAVLHYYKPKDDGSPPAPMYVNRPETYERPSETHSVFVRDMRDREMDFSLDKNGFQIHQNTASEKEFLDDERIKDAYYAEVEQLLKDV